MVIESNWLASHEKNMKTISIYINITYASLLFWISSYWCRCTMDFWANKRTSSIIWLNYSTLQRKQHFPFYMMSILVASWGFLYTEIHFFSHHHASSRLKSNPPNQMNQLAAFLGPKKAGVLSKAGNFQNFFSKSEIFAAKTELVLKTPHKMGPMMGPY